MPEQSKSFELLEMGAWDADSSYLKDKVLSFDDRYRDTFEKNEELSKILTKRSDLLSFGKVEQNIMTIWTGCIFETPPGWGLLITDPINDYYRYSKSKPYTIQAGILETDWMVYDIWINIAFKENCTVKIEKDKPVAALIPMRRDTYEEKWELENEDLNKFQYKRWLDYNYRKYGAYRHSKETNSKTEHDLGQMMKNQKVYHQQRKRNAKPKEEFKGNDYNKS